MKRIIISFLAVFSMFSCHQKDRYIYQDSTSKYYIDWKISDNDSPTDSLAIFYDFNSTKTVSQVGFYKDGFRNGKWNYNLGDSSIVIRWAYYRDTTLNFETNLFSYADSVKEGPFYTKFEFFKAVDTLNLIISVNSPLKDSIPEKNYEKITKKELKSIGVDIIHYNTIMKTNGFGGNIYIYTFTTKFNGKIRYVKGCYGFMDKNDFVDFSVGSLKVDDPYSTILFNAVLTNLYIKGKRFYNPLLIQDTE